MLHRTGIAVTAAAAVCGVVAGIVVVLGAPVGPRVPAGPPGDDHGSVRITAAADNRDR